jgi:hypothetical protein
MFMRIDNGKVLYFEKLNNSELDRNAILKLLQKFKIVTFNGLKYDQLIIEGALSGFTNEMLYSVSQAIIGEKLQPWEVRKRFGFPQIQVDHIDLIEVAPLRGGLKLYAARIHAPELQDLPIRFDAIIDEFDLPLLREYCKKDNVDTKLLYEKLKPQIALRESLSEKYKVDLRSKSDAQISEAVLKSELRRQFNLDVTRPNLKEDSFSFQCPEYVKFKTPLLQELQHDFISNPFTLNAAGHIQLPAKLKNRKFKIGETTYKVGVGGLHSCEKSTRHTNENHLLRDYDVASYYPSIILNNKLFPKHIGPAFLKIYKSIVDQRLKAKAAKDNVTSESLKITINGCFGKLASKWSFLYSPNLMMQVTVIGQLSLLMLIERMELAGIPVVSANTDGIVIKADYMEFGIEPIVAQWEKDTGYIMESKDYLSLNSRDVNNYIAIYSDGAKAKGAFVSSQLDSTLLKTNPAADICADAVIEFLKTGTLIADTIAACNDIRQFISVRTVNGKAVKNGRTLGTIIRWYYGVGESGAIHYKTNGNKVPKSDGAIPVMNLPDSIPADLDRKRYVAEAEKQLKSLGYQ